MLPRSIFSFCDGRIYVDTYIEIRLIEALPCVHNASYIFFLSCWSRQTENVKSNCSTLSFFYCLSTKEKSCFHQEHTQKYITMIYCNVP